MSNTPSPPTGVDARHEELLSTPRCGERVCRWAAETPSKRGPPTPVAPSMPCPLHALLGARAATAPPTATLAAPVSSLIVDSGASFHMHPRRGDLVRVRPCADSIVGVDRTSHACPHVGDLPLLARDAQGRYVKVVIKDVRHVPTLKDTLLSVAQLWRDNAVAARFQDECSLVLPDGTAIPMEPREHVRLLIKPRHFVRVL